MLAGDGDVWVHFWEVYFLHNPRSELVRLVESRGFMELARGRRTEVLVDVSVGYVIVEITWRRGVERHLRQQGEVYKPSFGV